MAAAGRTGAGDRHSAVVGCGDDDDDDGGSEGGGGDQAADVKQYPADSTLGKIQDAGELTIGVKYDVPPFGFENPQSGQIEGFDVDMGTLHRRGARSRAEVRGGHLGQSHSVPRGGTADLILSTMTINQERDMEIDFSEPYYIAEGRILVPKGLGHQGRR